MAFLTLFGGFERRADTQPVAPDTFREKLRRGFRKIYTGPYRFESMSFAVMFIIVGVTYIGICVAMPYGVGALINGSIALGQAALLGNRTANQHAIDNLGAVFPEALPEKTRNCATRAVANYVEDQWRGFYQQEVCAMDKDFCGTDEAAFMSVWRPKHNADHFYAYDLQGIGEYIGLVWPTASHLYQRLRSFALLQNPLNEKATPDLGRDKAAYAAYKQYITRCETLQPVGWASPKTPPLQKRGGLCMGDCP